VQERELRFVYEDYNSSYEELLADQMDKNNGSRNF
jgi:hypothetical protein